MVYKGVSGDSAVTSGANPCFTLGIFCIFAILANFLKWGIIFSIVTGLMAEPCHSTILARRTRGVSGELAGELQ